MSSKVYGEGASQLPGKDPAGSLMGSDDGRKGCDARQGGEMTDDYPIPDMDDTEDELRAEIDRLRAALEEIVRNGDQGIHVPGPYDIAKETLAKEGK